MNFENQLEIKQMDAAYAIIPKRGGVFTNLISHNVASIDDIDSLQNAVGYIGFEHYQEIEEISPPQKKTFCDMPSIYFATFEKFQEYDIKSYTPNVIPKVSWVESNMNKEQYFSNVEKVLEHIKKGTCYQVNLTRKFFGEFEYTPNPIDVFAKLYSISPNPYSMLLNIGCGKAVISSSPECFLKREGNKIFSVPIKGSLKSSDSIHKLRNIKDESENLMITDLVRNDIGKISNQVHVEEFQSIQTFSQIHHMSSKVIGTMADGVTNSNCIKATFPAGSMTGAPKIKAIVIANELEQIQRGIYSGCLGMIDDSHNFDFSVVIRTIILDGKKFEFQVGGAIVFDSHPQKEFEETITKAMPILTTLGLDISVFG